MLKKFILAAGVVFSLLSIAGCHSVAWHQERAVARAREYLLEHSRELTQMQIDFIRFNDPILLKSEIYSGAEAGGTTVGLGSELNQICVAWQVPDIPELLMVYGTSDSKMAHWYPERIIRKNFITHKQEFMAAVKTARNYAIANLLKQLTPVQLNRLRFTSPAVCQTNFSTSLDPQLKLTEEELETSFKKQTDGLQMSLVWPCENGTVLVFCGYAQSGFNGWEVNFAGKISQEELAAHTLKKLRTPADIQKPVNEQERDNFPVQPPVEAPDEDENKEEEEEVKEETAEENKVSKDPAEEKEEAKEEVR